MSQRWSRKASSFRYHEVRHLLTALSGRRWHRCCVGDGASYRRVTRRAPGGRRACSVRHWVRRDLNHTKDIPFAVAMMEGLWLLVLIGAVCHARAGDWLCFSACMRLRARHSRARRVSDQRCGGRSRCSCAGRPERAPAPDAFLCCTLSGSAHCVLHPRLFDHGCGLALGCVSAA